MKKTQDKNIVTNNTSQLNTKYVHYLYLNWWIEGDMCKAILVDILTGYMLGFELFNHVTIFRAHNFMFA